MSGKSNTAVIGGFVVGALALAVAGLLVFGGGRFFAGTSKHVLFFDGSVKGLNVGAPVNLKGVRIGSVRDIKTLFDRQEMALKIMVVIETDPKKVEPFNSMADSGGLQGEVKKEPGIDSLVDRGLRAQLGIQSLVTGLLDVNLDFYPNTPARLVGLQTEYTELPTIPSDLEQFSKTVQQLPLNEIANRLASALEGIEQFVTSGRAQETLASLNGAITDAQGLLRNVNGRVEPVTDSLNRTLADTRLLLKQLDSHVVPLAGDIRGTLSELKVLIKDLDKHLVILASGAGETLKSTQAAAKQAESALSVLEATAGDSSGLRYEVSTTLKELSDAARSMRYLADFLERHPEALIRGKSQ